MTYLDDQIHRTLHRCLTLRMSIEEHHPALGVCIQAKALRTALDDLIPELESAHDTDIRTLVLSEAAERGLINYLEEDRADTDQGQG
jgi:hypothetical protein